jgi:hypothetical protein
MAELASDPIHASGFAALPLAVSSPSGNAIIPTHMPDSPAPTPPPKPRPRPIVTDIRKASDPGSDPSKVMCERCGAEMYRMHAVWRCASCGFKTDCCGW